MAKFVYMAMLGILCINMSIYLVNEYDLLNEVEYIAPISPGDLSDTVDINGTITPDNQLSSTLGYDIWGMMGKLWRLTRTMVIGLPELMLEIGTPTPIMLVIDALYVFMWGVFYIEMGIGRDIGE